MIRVLGSNQVTSSLSDVISALEEGGRQADNGGRQAGWKKGGRHASVYVSNYTESTARILSVFEYRGESVSFMLTCNRVIVRFLSSNDDVVL